MPWFLDSFVPWLLDALITCVLDLLFLDSLFPWFCDALAVRFLDSLIPGSRCILDSLSPRNLGIPPYRQQLDLVFWGQMRRPVRCLTLCFVCASLCVGSSLCVCVCVRAIELCIITIIIIIFNFGPRVFARLFSFRSLQSFSLSDLHHARQEGDEEGLQEGRSTSTKGQGSFMFIL